MDVEKHQVPRIVHCRVDHVVVAETEGLEHDMGMVPLPVRVAVLRVVQMELVESSLAGRAWLEPLVVESRPEVERELLPMGRAWHEAVQAADTEAMAVLAVHGPARHCPASA